LLALAVGWALTFAGWRLLVARHEARLDDQLRRHGTNMLLNFQGQTAHRVVFLNGLRGLFSSLTNFSRAEFEHYVRASDSESSDEAVIDQGFAPRVTAAEWPAFRERMLREGFTAAHFPENPPRLDQGECFPIAYFTDQRTRSVVPIGYSLNSESNRLAAIRAACRTGKTTATGPVRVHSADVQHDEPGFLLFAPVHEAKFDREPEAPVRGVAFVSLSAERLWRGAVGEFPGLVLRVYDGGQLARDRLIYESDGGAHADVLPHIWFSMTGLGRDWTIAVVPLPEFRALAGPLPNGWLIAAGVAASFGVFATMLAQALGRRRSDANAVRLALSEAALRRREKALAAVAELGPLLARTQFAGDRLPEALQRIGTAAAADRVHLRLVRDLPDQGRCLCPVAEWCGLGTPSTVLHSAVERLPLGGWIGDWFERCRRDGMIMGARADFPDGERSVLEATGVTAVLAIPMWTDGEPGGLILFERCQDVRQWEADELELLRGGCLALGLALERTRAEDLLGHEAERLTVTLESVTEGIVVTDPEGRISLMNRVALGFAGTTWDQARGRLATQLLRLEDPTARSSVSSLIRQALKLSHPEELSTVFTLHLAAGRTVSVAVTVAALRVPNRGVQGAVICLRDITERQRLAEEQLRASKLESVGQLAGGIAHDFNNLLAAMLGNVSLAGQMLDAPGELETCLKQTEAAIWRARGLTQQLLTFAKGGAPVARSTDVRTVSRQAVELALRGTHVRLEQDFAAELWPAEVDPGQLAQVFQNLALNAVQAMNGQGQLWLSARNVPATAPDRPTSLRGDAICFTVRDAGPGLSPQAMGRLFEPYFTTRSGASGLGLATAYNIVRRHSGLLTADASPGQGACFSVWLPATVKPVTMPEVKLASPLGQLRGRLLIMDDDPAVQAVAVQLARRVGLEVAAAANGEGALELYQKAMAERRPFQAVLLDLTIVGGLGGLETLRRLRQLDPEVVAVVSSGYSNDPVLANFEAEGFRGILEKPYSADQFVAVLREVLAGPAPAR
jgi:PAS domain S-box-containing protein